MKLTDLGFEHVSKVTTLQIHSKIVHLNTFGTEKNRKLCGRYI